MIAPAKPAAVQQQLPGIDRPGTEQKPKEWRLQRWSGDNADDYRTIWTCEAPEPLVELLNGMKHTIKRGLARIVDPNDDTVQVEPVEVYLKITARKASR